MRRWILAALALFAISQSGRALILGTERSARKSVSGDLYRDVTPQSGICFRFRGDFMDGKLIPAMGGGAALADVDADGVLDVFFVQQVKNAKQYRKSGGTQPLGRCSRLYRGRGDGTFEDITERSGIRACGWGIGALFADLDSDGDVDLIVGNAGRPNSVWRNEGNGTFTKVENTGLESGRFAIGMAALDANGDGIVDIW